MVSRWLVAAEAWVPSGAWRCYQGGPAKWNPRTVLGAPVLGSRGRRARQAEFPERSHLVFGAPISPARGPADTGRCAPPWGPKWDEGGKRPAEQALPALIRVGHVAEQEREVGLIA
jgi:hypothetical protein